MLRLGTSLCFCLAGALGRAAGAADGPQSGQRYTRNMVSDETGLPERFDPKSGLNIRWTAPLGSQTYATPAVARGRVLIGTNNDRPRDSRHRGDRGVLLCLDEKDGKLLWQLVVHKREGDRYQDWPRIGIVSQPAVEGDRVYVPTNRGEIVCLDLDGLADGNDGPFRGEGAFMSPEGAPPMKVTRKDADIVWLFDTHAEVGSYPHDSTHASILIHGRFLYVNTSNGVDNTHRRIRSPDAPSLIVLDKTTGRLVAQDDERIGPRIFHCAWSSPALGKVGGRTLAFYAGGDGVCYAFEALQASFASRQPARLRKVWWFDCDPTAPKETVHKWVGNRKEGPSTINSDPVYHDGRVYVGGGGDVWWGKRKAWLKCIDASGAGRVASGPPTKDTRRGRVASGRSTKDTRRGDVTRTAGVWTYPLGKHCNSTPSIHDGLVYIADCEGQVHCIDADTAAPYWIHKLKGEIWSSTLVADGKVYVGCRRRQFCVLAVGREKKVLSSTQLDSGIVGSPIAAGGVLYVTTMKRLYAVAKGARRIVGRRARARYLADGSGARPVANP